MEFEVPSKPYPVAGSRFEGRKKRSGIPESMKADHLPDDCCNLGRIPVKVGDIARIEPVSPVYGFLVTVRQNQNQPAVVKEGPQVRQLRHRLVAVRNENSHARAPEGSFDTPA
jgi:hypothetical protein